MHVDGCVVSVSKEQYRERQKKREQRQIARPSNKHASRAQLQGVGRALASVPGAEIQNQHGLNNLKDQQSRGKGAAQARDTIEWATSEGAADQACAERGRGGAKERDDHAR